MCPAAAVQAARACGRAAPGREGEWAWHLQRQTWQSKNKTAIETEEAETGEPMVVLSVEQVEAAQNLLVRGLLPAWSAWGRLILLYGQLLA